MIEKLLRAKHWQLFLGTIGTAILGQMVIMTIIFSTEDPKNIFYGLAVLPIVLFIVLYIQMGWQYGIIFKLKDKINVPLNLPYQRIKIFFFVPIFYFILLLIAIASIIPSFQSTSFHPGPGFFAVVFLFFMLHFFSIFCLFHTAYFAGKTMKMVEMRKKVTFNDFAGEFLLIWFNAVGFWILQPRINKLIDAEPGELKAITKKTNTTKVDDIDEIV